MTLLDFQQACAALRDDAPARIAAAGSLDAWHELRNALVGRKSGRLSELMALLPQLDKEDRREAGAAVNTLKQALEGSLDARKTELESSAPRGIQRDLTMPGRDAWRGAVHPVSLVIDEICDIFRELGFTVALGPEAESPWYKIGRASCRERV